MIYPNTLGLQVYGATKGIHCPITRYGIGVYVDTDPDSIGPDFFIDPADEKGIEIFREFAAKMAAHYNTLKK
jgi:hypothetical protein